MRDKLNRGDEVRRPTGWIVRLVDRQAALGWASLLSQTPANLDRAWIAITADPRGHDDVARRHRLKFDLKAVKIDGVELEQWQYEVTGGGRICMRSMTINASFGSRRPAPATLVGPTSADADIQSASG
ncbi:hypothetical protein [Sphaerisporangium dianthi]|uniref:Uncharacterized protein n=1 Tax=Sphaerisporangium dianthi TaxID=1436120 RepID=A0ABV9CH50_9ACTN